MSTIIGNSAMICFFSDGSYLHWSIAQSSLRAFIMQAVNVRLYPSEGAMRSDRCTRYGRQEIHQVKHEDCVKPFIWNPRLEDRLSVIGTMPQKPGAEPCFLWLSSIGPGLSIYALTIARACVHVVHSAT